MRDPSRPRPAALVVKDPLDPADSRTLDTIPAADGFRMPAEFAPHDGMWMAWPERPDNWRQDARPAQEAFAAVAAAIAACEPVTVGASPAQVDAARELLPVGVRVVELATDDAWMRDIGPTFLTGPAAGAAEPTGSSTPGAATTGSTRHGTPTTPAAARVLEIEGADRYRAPFVLEGGAIHVDGEGTVLTTEECLLSPGRNPSLVTRADRAPLLRLARRREGALARSRRPRRRDDGPHRQPRVLPRPGVVALTWTDDESDPQHAISARRRAPAARDDRRTRAGDRGVTGSTSPAR